MRITATSRSRAAGHTTRASPYRPWSSLVGSHGFPPFLVHEPSIGVPSAPSWWMRMLPQPPPVDHLVVRSGLTPIEPDVHGLWWHEKVVARERWRWPRLRSPWSQGAGHGHGHGRGRATRAQQRTRASADRPNPGSCRRACRCRCRSGACAASCACIASRRRRAARRSAWPGPPACAASTAHAAGTHRVSG